MLRLLLPATLVALLTSETGCASVVASYPKCETPVLLSKVNRVGVAKPAPVRETGTEDVLSGGVEFFVSVSRSSETHGNTTTTKTTTEARLAGAMSLTAEVLGEVPTAADLADTDIQLDGVSTGDFLLLSSGYAQNHIWADPKGRKVWVR